jgi:RimJ/RimL family protein N-acetyltransferase
LSAQSIELFAVSVSPVTLRAVTDGDRFRLRRWLAEPHVIQWWGSRSAAEAAVALAAGSETAVCRIIARDGDAIGYAHALDLADRRLPPACWQADVFIGAQTLRGQGLGATALALLKAELFATTMAHTLAVRVSIRNERAVRAIERVGFKWREVVPDAQLGPCWVLVAER